MLDDINPKPLEEQPNKPITQEELNNSSINNMKEIHSMDNKDVSGIVKVGTLIGHGVDAVNAATSPDSPGGKAIVPTEYPGLVMAVFSDVMPAFNGLKDIPSEVAAGEEISAKDQADLQAMLDQCKTLKGDTRDAVKELIPHLAGLKNWADKYFFKAQPPSPNA